MLDAMETGGIFVLLFPHFSPFISARFISAPFYQHLLSFIADLRGTMHYRAGGSFPSIHMEWRMRSLEMMEGEVDLVTMEQKVSWKLLWLIQLVGQSVTDAVASS